MQGSSVTLCHLCRLYGMGACSGGLDLPLNYCSKNLKSPLNLHANQHLHWFSPPLILILHPPLGAWHRVLDLGDDVMLPPFAGETEVQLQHHREAFFWCFFLLPTLQLASATFLPSQHLNKVLKTDMMQCNTASCLSMARLSWRGNTAL
jgi:hypothetical protein